MKFSCFASLMTSFHSKFAPKSRNLIEIKFLEIAKSFLFPFSKVHHIAILRRPTWKFARWRLIEMQAMLLQMNVFNVSIQNSVNVCWMVSSLYFFLLKPLANYFAITLNYLSKYYSRNTSIDKVIEGGFQVFPSVTIYGIFID